MSVGKLKRYGLPFSNVVANGVATANVTPGRTIEQIRLKLGGTFTKAMITLLRVKANGKTVIECTGTQLDKLNTYRGKAANAAYLDIDFSDFSLNNEFDRNVGAFDTSQGVANITVEITITGATSPTLVAIVTESAAQKNVQGDAAPYAGIMAKILRYPFNMASGGRLPLTVPFGPQSGSIIKRLHVEHTGTMTGATVKQDGLVIHESLAAENQYDQQSMIPARVPQTNLYTIDFVADGAVNKALNTRDAKSLEWLFDFSAAGSGDVLVEYLDPLGNL